MPATVAPEGPRDPPSRRCSWARPVVARWARARVARRTPGRGLHPEDAEPGLRNRRVQRGLEPDREDAAGVERVDDAVVPQPRGGEVGRPFTLVCLEDGRLEGLALDV